MTRVTRSRQAASSVETNVKTTRKRAVATGAITKKNIGETRSNVKQVSNQDENAVPITQNNKIIKTRSNLKKMLDQDENTVPITQNNKIIKTKSNFKKASDQDENAVPITQIKKMSKDKSSKSKGTVLGSKLLVNKDDTLHSSVLTIKSPVLRDRTNTTNELVKTDAVSRLSDKLSLSENKNSTVTSTTRNTTKLSMVKQKTLHVCIERYVVKQPRAQTEDQSKNNKPQNKILLSNKEDTETISDKKDINENMKKSGHLLSQDKSKSETVPVTKKAMKRKNMSMEDVERLLNEDDDDEDTEDHLTSDSDEADEAESLHEENVKKDNPKAKKFFKYKGTEQEKKSCSLPKKNPSQNKKSRTAKKLKNNDSTFSPKIETQRQSIKPENKKLRTRVAKNYCETSRLSTPAAETTENTDKPIENDKKGLPIYRTVQLAKEDKKGKPNEIYEFDEFQDDGQKGKKRKKTIKRPIIKRARKITNQPFGYVPQPKKKTVKIFNKSVQSKLENVNKLNTNAVLSEKKVDNTINTKKSAITNQTETNCVIYNNLPQIGDSTFEEAPTIKIVSNKKLDGYNRYHLTNTPLAPKTTVSELKLCDPKNNMYSQPNQQLKKMANHSLIRESMSPIRKINDEFDTGSPWRVPIDTFTRVRRLVQSTPQIKRQAVQKKKPLQHVAELNKKSIGSEETIHLSTVASNKSPNKERSLEEMSTIKQNAPRKFGTVISNLSPSKSTNATTSSDNSTTQKSPLQSSPLQTNNQRSSLKTVSPPSSDPILPVNFKKLDFDDLSISFDNKENISPKSSPKKKIVTPSPFRFERIRSSKRLTGIVSISKSPEKALPTKPHEPEPQAGPSWLDKPKPTVMRQTNLNNFLNLVDMPESANISTPHGIFDDVCSTPVNGKKPKNFVEEANIENAFGFDDFDCDDTENVENVSTVKIATEADVKNSVKGKLFPKARVKSSVPSRISENTVKKVLLTNVIKKKIVEVPEILQEQEDTDSSSSGKYNKHANNDQVVPHKESEKHKKKTILNAISFSDTFDVLSENGEDLEAKVPKEIPLFVDLEPAHFTEPPRRSYNKRKRNACFDEDRYESSDDEEIHEKKKAKKRKQKESHLNKEEKKRMEDWVKNVNRTFEEIEHFDLVVE